MSPASGEKTQVIRMAMCYALSVTSISLTVATAPIVGLELAPSASLATIPVSIQVLGTMLAGLPASLLMGKLGRKRGFLIGTAVGAGGAATATLGIITGSFILFCIGGLGIGMLNGTAQLYRFAAADGAPSWRAKAISYVMAGGIAAGVLGPWLASTAQDSISAAPFAGSYAAILLLYLGAAVFLRGTQFTPPTPRQVGDARPLGTIFRAPLVLAAVLGAMTAYGTMSLVMTATPLTMRAAGFSFATGSQVIQAHVVAMFLPSFFTGSLIQRFGKARIAGLGVVALLGTAALAIGATTFREFIIALVLLGIGWNFLFISSTALLTSLHAPAEASKVQGLNDLLVFGSAAAGSFLAGYLLQRIGWDGMHQMLLPIVLAASGIIAVLAWMGSQKAAPIQ